MAGHRKFSELTKNFSPERKRWIAAKTAAAIAEIEREKKSPSICETNNDCNPKDNRQ